MPLAPNSLPTEVTIGVRDYNNEDATTSVFYPAAGSILDLSVNVALVEAAIAGLTDGFIYGGGLSRRYNQTDDPPPTGAPATSNVQRKGVFIFENSFGGYNTYRIPSISRAVVLPGSNKIDRENSAVQDYVTLMLSALNGVVGLRPTGGNGYQLVRLVDAYEDTVSRPNSQR